MAELDKAKEKSGYLEGKLLIATPQIRLSCFARSVIYVCVHNSNGAMGIIVNQTITDLDSKSLWQHFDLELKNDQIYLPIHFGGPVEPARGFVLHSDDYRNLKVLHTGGGFSVSSNIDILKDIADGGGPRKKILALGYAGWTAGQLESEIESNSWLVAPAENDIIFGSENDGKWQKAAKLVGIDMMRLSPDIGHA